MDPPTPFMGKKEQKYENQASFNLAEVAASLVAEVLCRWRFKMKGERSRFHERIKRNLHGSII